MWKIIFLPRVITSYSIHYTKLYDAELDKEAADKVYASDRTNDIHMEIVALASKIQKLALEGIEINLDPPCVALFKNAVDEAWVIKQRSKRNNFV